LKREFKGFENAHEITFACPGGFPAPLNPVYAIIGLCFATCDETALATALVKVDDYWSGFADVL